MSRRTTYKNPRFLDKSSQVILFYNPIRAYTHRVRDIQTLDDGQTYGWVRHQSGDWVVRFVKDHGGVGNDAWIVTEKSTRELVR